MKPIRLFLSMFSAIAMAIAGFGQPVPDQSQLNNNGGMTVKTLAGYSVFQSFTAGYTGTLSEIDMGFFNHINGAGTLNIYSGSGVSGPLLQSKTVNVIGEANRGTMIAFAVSVPVTVGKVYTFQFIPGAGMADSYGVQLSKPGTYTRGYMGLIDSGGTHDTGLDMVFKTFVSAISGNACTDPVSLLATNITPNGAMLSWASTTSVVSFNVQYRNMAETSWITLSNLGNNSATLSTLLPSASYLWQVQSNCAAGVSAFTAGEPFTTPASTTCSDPYELNNNFKSAAAITTGTKINALINNSTDADYFKFSIGAVKQTNLRITLSNLPAAYHIYLYNNKYELKASTEALTGTIDNIIIYNSTAANASYYVVVKGDNGVFDVNRCYSLLVETDAFVYTAVARTLRIDEPAAEPYVYPNPVTNELILQFDNKVTKVARLVIVDVQGRMFATRNISLYKGLQTVRIPVNELVKGTYFMEGAGIKMVKFVKL